MSNVTSNITLKGYFIFYFKGFKKKLNRTGYLQGKGWKEVTSEKSVGKGNMSGKLLEQTKRKSCSFLLQDGVVRGTFSLEEFSAFHSGREMEHRPL